MYQIASLEGSSKSVTTRIQRLKKMFTAKESEWEQTRDDLQSQLAAKIREMKEMQRQIVELKQRTKNDERYRNQIKSLRAELTQKNGKIENYENQLILQKQTVNINQSDGQIVELKLALRREQEKSEKFRGAAIAFKKLATNLPPARISRIVRVVKEENHERNKYIIRRSKQLDSHKQSVERNGVRKIISNNPMNRNGDGPIMYSRKLLSNIRSFVDEYGIGGSESGINRVKQLLKIKKAPKYDHLPMLEGQNECVARVNIDEGVILGQYYGAEMLKSEFDATYNGTMEELEHLKYSHGEELRLPNGEVVNITIDPLAFVGDKSSLSPLCFMMDVSISKRMRLQRMKSV